MVTDSAFLDTPESIGSIATGRSPFRPISTESPCPAVITLVGVRQEPLGTSKSTAVRRNISITSPSRINLSDQPTASYQPGVPGWRTQRRRQPRHRISPEFPAPQRGGDSLETCEIPIDKVLSMPRLLG